MRVVFPGFSDQSKGTRAAQIDLQLIAAISDFGIETGLVDGPEGVEIVGAVVADCESHVSILDRVAACTRKAMKYGDLQESAKFSKNYLEGLDR
jgi:hypothetical protein